MEQIDLIISDALQGIERAICSADAVLFLLGSVAREMTERTYARRLPYFQEWRIK
ncbi:hypothetical protein FHS80_001767 [Porphyromonas circumdentaria]|nr:hypothetical protein [Porphyromonas circumdentaria]